MSRRDSEMRLSVVRLLEIFESYAIAVPEFEVFQDALNSAIYDVGEAFEPLYQLARRILPVYAPGDERPSGAANKQPATSAYVPPPLSDAEFEVLDPLVDSYLEAAEDVACYIFDLRVESQNLLLSDLYADQRAPRREPRDPIHKVICTEHAEALKTYFRNETPWGKNAQRLDEEAHR